MALFNSCNSDEFYDVHTATCINCVNICSPRHRTADECSRFCPDYSILVTSATPGDVSTPPVDGVQNLHVLSVTLLFFVVAFCVLLVLCLVFHGYLWKQIQMKARLIDRRRDERLCFGAGWLKIVRIGPAIKVLLRRRVICCEMKCRGSAEGSNSGNPPDGEVCPTDRGSEAGQNEDKQELPSTADVRSEDSGHGSSDPNGSEGFDETEPLHTSSVVPESKIRHYENDDTYPKQRTGCNNAGPESCYETSTTDDIKMSLTSADSINDHVTYGGEPTPCYSVSKTRHREDDEYVLYSSIQVSDSADISHHDTLPNDDHTDRNGSSPHASLRSSSGYNSGSGNSCSPQLAHPPSRVILDEVSAERLQSNRPDSDTDYRSTSSGCKDVCPSETYSFVSDPSIPPTEIRHQPNEQTNVTEYMQSPSNSYDHVITVCNLIEAKSHMFTWIAGFMISNDAVEVFVCQDTVDIDSAANDLLKEIPDKLQRFLRVTPECQ